MKKICLILVLMTFSAWAEFQSIEAKRLISMQKKGIPVIDIRTPQEWKERGIIPGSHLMMFFDESGRPHIKEWLDKFSKLVKKKNQPFIIYCAHANRSKTLGRWLSDKLGYQKVYELKGGIEFGWRDLGFKIVQPNL